MIPTYVQPQRMEMEPIALELTFDYADDVPVATEESITDAKRRRLEQERRVNEANNALPNDGTLDVVASVQGLLGNPEFCGHFSLRQAIDAPQPHDLATLWRQRVESPGQHPQFLCGGSLTFRRDVLY